MRHPRRGLRPRSRAPTASSSATSGRSARATSSPRCSIRAGWSRSSSRRWCPNEADLPRHDHRQELRPRRQRARPQLRQERPVHARRRGGVHAARRRDVRPRPAHRHGARGDRGPRARAAGQPGADAVGARDRDAGVPHALPTSNASCGSCALTSPDSPRERGCASARRARIRSASSSASASPRATATATSSTSCSTSRGAS